MQSHQHQLVFRFASLPPGHAYSSTDTELRAIHLFELSCPVNARISAWSDSQNCATLVPHLTHGSEEQIRYRTRNSEMRATAMAIFNLNQRYLENSGPAGAPKIKVEWVKGHSEEENLYVVGNRMIDALLRAGTLPWIALFPPYSTASPRRASLCSATQLMSWAIIALCSCASSAHRPNPRGRTPPLKDASSTCTRKRCSNQSL